jgi:hypothetical protein
MGLAKAFRISAWFTSFPSAMDAMITFQLSGKLNGKFLLPRQEPQGIVTDFINLTSSKLFVGFVDKAAGPVP